MAKFIAKARASMERRGTVGSYGKASPGKIKRDLAKGGAIAKKAQFAKAMKTVARERKGKS